MLWQPFRLHLFWTPKGSHSIARGEAPGLVASAYFPGWRAHTSLKYPLPAGAAKVVGGVLSAGP